jgi:flagellar motility protein MotE (MotC chaperone)
MKQIQLIIFYAFFSLFFAGIATTGIGADQDEPSSADNGNNYRSVEERRLLVALEEERINLKNEREELAKKKNTLKSLQQEVDKKLEELKQQRIELEKLLAEKDAQELQRIQELSKMYGKMGAEKAARVFGSLEQDLAVAILAKMKTKSAAKILNNMDRDKAAALTTAFSTLETP